MVIKRGDIFYADLKEGMGSEQTGTRPVLIIQNDVGNKFSNTVIVLPITSKGKSNIPTHVNIQGKKCGLEKNSVILAEQVRTLDKKRLKKKVGVIDNKMLEEVRKAIEISLGIRGGLNWEDMLEYLLDTCN